MSGDLALSRREMVARFGTAAAASGAGILALPAAVRSFPSKADGGAVDPDATPLAEADLPYAVWHYKPVADGFEPTAPINVVFPLASRSFDDVVAVFRDTGWHAGPVEYPRYAWDRATGEFRFHDYSAAESYFGMAGRLHVRCWELDGTASVQAHVDTPATPKHGIATYVGARHAVEELFEAAGWRVDDERIHLGNDSAPDHDGFASVIHG